MLLLSCEMQLTYQPRPILMTHHQNASHAPHGLSSACAMVEETLAIRTTKATPAADTQADRWAEAYQRSCGTRIRPDLHEPLTQFIENRHPQPLLILMHPYLLDWRGHRLSPLISLTESHHISSVTERPYNALENLRKVRTICFFSE